MSSPGGTDMVEETLIVCAGPCVLAIARQLRHRHGVRALVLDRDTAPASAWRARYDGFRLNTCGWWSHLPGQRIPVRHGRWPNREAMVDYFDDYVRRQDIRLALGTDVHRIERHDATWQVITGHHRYTAPAVVVATGNYRQPWQPHWDGVDTFTGRLLHSAQYRNPAPVRDQDVLVVGCGNSAADIAVQLCDDVARRVRMAIRTPPHLVRRSTGGVPADAFALLTGRAPVPLVDRAGALLRRLTFGDLSEYGFELPTEGIYRTVLDTGRIPTLADVLVDRVRAGKVEIVPAVDGFAGDQVLLANGGKITVDSVVAATGFRQGLEDMVGHLGVLHQDGHPRTNGVDAAVPGLWFAGYAEPFTGPLRSFRRQASPVADAVATHVRHTRR